MRKPVLLGGAALAALIPAALGLAANPSLSARTPLPPSQVDLVQHSTPEDRPRATSPTSEPTSVPKLTSVPDDSATTSDDHGGSRARDDVSDDAASHDATDDHGGDRSTSSLTSSGRSGEHESVGRSRGSDDGKSTTAPSASADDAGGVDDHGGGRGRGGHDDGSGHN